MMFMAAVPPIAAKPQFGYFDGVVLVWLIIGLFRGRKRGMSQELLPMFQWIAIVAAGGLLYKPFSYLVSQYLPFDTLWSCITAYLLIAAGIHLVYAWFRQMFAARLVELDLFGRGEFYLGMMAGVVRFACMLLFGMALMNAHIVPEAERAKNAKMQNDSFSGMQFKTPAEFQQDVLFRCFVGKLVETNLSTILITSIRPGPAPKKKPATESIAQKREREIDQITSRPEKTNNADNTNNTGKP